MEARRGRGMSCRLNVYYTDKFGMKRERGDVEELCMWYMRSLVAWMSLSLKSVSNQERAARC